jgi:hypothetical protein
LSLLKSTPQLSSSSPTPRPFCGGEVREDGRTRGRREGGKGREEGGGGTEKGTEEARGGRRRRDLWRQKEEEGGRRRMKEAAGGRKAGQRDTNRVSMELEAGVDPPDLENSVCM